MSEKAASVLTFDCDNGYWQTEMFEADSDKITFSRNLELFQKQDKFCRKRAQSVGDFHSCFDYD